MNDPSPTSSTLQLYTPGTLLNKGEVSVKLFNNLYTQTAFFDRSWTRSTSSVRSTYFTALLETLYGIHPKFNIGIDAFLKSVHIDPQKESPLNVFHFREGPNSRTALTHTGPKLRFSPISSLPSFSVQSSFLFPVASQLEGRSSQAPYLAFNGYIWWTRGFWEKTYQSTFQIFTETAFLFHLDRHLSMPNSYVRGEQKAFFKYFPTDRLTIYVMADLAPTFGTNPFISSFYMHEGGGMQYQITSFLEVELLYSHFSIGYNAGAGQTFNIGIRFLE